MSLRRLVFSRIAVFAGALSLASASAGASLIPVPQGSHWKAPNPVSADGEAIMGDDEREAFAGFPEEDAEAPHVAPVPGLELPVDDRLNDPRLPRPPYLQRFRKLDDRLYRGSQPTSADLKFLKEQGIRTIVSFVRTPRDLIEWEQQEAAIQGLQFLSFPIHSFMGPSREKITAIFAELLRDAAQPVFFHCKHGKDRTGLVAGLYRRHFQGWSPEQAYAEARALGFSPLLLGLRSKFKRYLAEAPWLETPGSLSFWNLGQSPGMLPALP
jgi:protein tyrosine phosphatase (PTP) superfamily phosphohydrolase (DUF442 family)